MLSCKTVGEYDITDHNSFKIKKIIKCRIKNATGKKQGRWFTKRSYILYAENYFGNCKIYSPCLRKDERIFKVKDRIRKNGVYHIDVELYNDPNNIMRYEEKSTSRINSDSIFFIYHNYYPDTVRIPGIKAYMFWPLFSYEREEKGEDYPRHYKAVNLEGLNLIDLNSKRWDYYTDKDNIKISIDETGAQDTVFINGADYIVTDKQHGKIGSLCLYMTPNSDTIYFEAGGLRSFQSVNHTLVPLSEVIQKKEVERIENNSSNILYTKHDYLLMYLRKRANRPGFDDYVMKLRK